MSRTTTEKFVDRVHRRLVIYRTLEQIGLGMLLASLLATTLNLLAIWQAMPTLPILLFSVCFGLLVGLVLTIYRWPARLSAVSEADRQLRFDDLLTSALFPSENKDDFTNLVQAMADAKCGQHSPNEVFVRCLSARTWSAIGLAMSVAVILGVIPFGAVRSQAIDVNAAVLSENLAGPVETSNGKSSQQMNDPTSEGAWSGEVSSEQKTDAAASQSKNSRGLGNGSSSGGGSVTNEHIVDQRPQNIGAAGTQSARGDAAGGGAATENQAERGDKSNGQQSMRSRAQNQIPSWTGDAKTGGSSNSIVPSNDRIPPEDRDLIRDFFDGH